MAWEFACPDWEARIRSGKSLIPELPLNLEEAERAVGIFNKLRLPDVPGTPELKHAAGEWFRDIVRVAFGSLVDGRRMVPEILCLAPKKSSKTSYSAALMLTALLMNKRKRAELLFIAPSKLIAQIAFDQAVGMIQEDPEGYLQKRTHIQDNIKQIKDLKTGARLQIKSFNHQVLVGIKPVAVLVDELWEIARDSKAVGILRQIRGGLEVNKEGLLVFITTQSDERPRGVFETELNAARAIRDGRIKGKMLPIMYEFPLEIAKNEELWANPVYWPMVNPNLNRPVSIDTLIQSWNDEKEKGSLAKEIWASQHLNIQVGLGSFSDRWAGALFWEKNSAPLLTLEDILEQCDVVVVGIDGGGMDDLLGLVVLGRKKGTTEDPDARDWLMWSRAWGHQSVLDQRKDIASLLQSFERHGHLKIISDDSPLDVQEVADIVMRIDATGLFPDKGAIGVDSVGITDITDELTLRGFDCSLEGMRVFPVNQGWKLNNVIKTTARRLAQGALRHEGSPMLAWCVKNARVEMRGNAETITKQGASTSGSGSAKIDPLIALFDAVFLMVRNPVAAKRGSYLEHAEHLIVLA